MTKAIAVDGCTLEFQNGGNNSAISISPMQTSNKAKAEGKVIYKTLKFTVSGYTAPSASKPNWIPESGSVVGQVSINPSSIKTKVEGNNVILEGDVSASFTIIGQSQSGQTTVMDTFVEVVKVTKAGQSKVKGS